MEYEYSDAYREWMNSKNKTIIGQPFKYKYNNLTSVNVGAEATQSRYSLKDDNLVAPVRNQGNTGACWAFATTDAIHSNYLKSHTGDATLINKLFSPVHIELIANNNTIESLNTLNRLPINRNLNDGGNYFVSSAYLMNLRGPIYENDNLNFDDYVKFLKDNGVDNNLTVPDGANDLDMNVIKDLKPEIQVKNIGAYTDTYNTGNCTENMRNVMKQLIVTNGALASTMYLDSQYFESNEFKYYYYDGNEGVNHGVLITGWDDDVEISNFNLNHHPDIKGAWIIKNSYGNSFGNDGYFYLSYEDTKICNAVFSFYDIADTVPDNVYYYDDLFPTIGASIRTDKSFYLANKFKRNTSSTQKERIDSVAMFMPASNTNYNVYYSSTGDLNKLTKIASGVSNTTGYSVIPVDSDKKVILNDSESENYAIIYELVPNGTTDYDLWFYGKDSSYLSNVNATSDVSYYAIDAPVLENWDPIIQDNAGTPVNSTIKVYTSYVADTEISILDPETTYVVGSGNNGNNNAGTNNNNNNNDGGNTNNNGGTNNNDDGNTNNNGGTNNTDGGNTNNNGNTNNSEGSNTNNNEGNTSNNNAGNNNNNNVTVVDKNKVNTIKLVNNPLNDEKDPTKLDAQRNAVDVNVKNYGTIDNPNTGAIISVIVISVALITLIVLHRINRKKILYKI